MNPESSIDEEVTPLETGIDYYSLWQTRATTMVGDLVYSADGAELGTVQAVLAPLSEEIPARFVIAKSVFLDASRCIALGQVESVQNGIVTLRLKARHVEQLFPYRENE